MEQTAQLTQLGEESRRQTAQRECGELARLITTTESRISALVQELFESVEAIEASQPTAGHAAAADKTPPLRVYPSLHDVVMTLPLWDLTVGTQEQELQSCTDFLSPFKPVLSFAVDHVNFPLHPVNIQHLLQRHPHGSIVVNACERGFSMMAVLTPCRADRPNPRFVPSVEDQIDEWMSKQHDTGKLLDISALPFPMYGIVSPIVPVSKNGTSEIRPCHNLSAGQPSVNSSISFQVLEPLDLLSIEAVCHRIRFCIARDSAASVFAAKVDLKQYFRQLPLRQREYWMVMQRLRSRLMVNTATSFGCKSATHNASMLTCCIGDLLADKNHWVRFFLDDAIMVGSFEEVTAAISALRAILTEFGLAENLDKHVPPCQELTILGVWFNLREFSMGITDARRVDILTSIVNVLGRRARTATVLELQQLGGRLSFVSTIHPFGRVHTTPIWKLLAGDMAGAQPTVHVRISREARAGLLWWRDLLSTGILCFFPHALKLGITIEHPLLCMAGISSDASGLGFGAVSMEHKLVLQGVWAAAAVEAFSINIRECATVLFMVALLGPLLSGHLVIFECDNLASVCANLKQSSFHPELSAIVLDLCTLQETFKFFLVVTHLPGADNCISDAVSRGVPLKSCLPDQALDWCELRLSTTSVDSLGTLARWSSSERASQGPIQLDCTPPSSSSTDFVGSGSKRNCHPQAITSTFPWIPYSQVPLEYQLTGKQDQ